MSFQVPPNHYRLSSQSLGGFTFDSVGRATSVGASTADPEYFPLNPPPSAAFLPPSAGKVPLYNGRTMPFAGTNTFGQSRTASQSIQWTPAAGPPTMPDTSTLAMQQSFSKA